MSGEARYAEAYGRLLQEAGIARYEHLRDMGADLVVHRVEAANERVGLFSQLDAQGAAEWLVSQALEHEGGEITIEHLPGDSDPCWGAMRLGHPPRGNEVEWRLPDERGTLSGSVLPGRIDLDYGWGGKPTDPAGQPGSGGHGGDDQRQGGAKPASGH